MFSLSEILIPVAVVFLQIGVGIILRRSGTIDASADRSLTKLIINLFFPCLIFSKIIGNPALDNPTNLFWAPLIGFVSVAGGYGICYVLAPFIGIKNAKTRGAFCLTTGNFNYGFIPITLALSIFDDRTVGALFLHNMGVDAAIWSLGIALLTGAIGKDTIKLLINGPLCTIIVGILIDRLGFATAIPKVVMDTTDTLGNCAIPVSLLMIGMTIGNHVNTRPAWRSMRIVIPACILRLLILPILMLTLALFLPISIELKRVIALQVAMPSAVFPIVLTAHYDSDEKTAMRVVIATSLLSIVTMPLWLSFGLRLISQ